MKRFLTVCAVVLLCAGCAGRGREKPVVTYRSAEPGMLVAAYNSNAARIPSLSADLELTIIYTDEGRTKKRTVDAWLDVEKPARIRLKHDDISRPMFLVLSDGVHFWVCLDKAIAGGEDTVYTGTLAALESEWLLRPDRLLSAFSLGRFPPDGATETVSETYSDRYIVSFLGDKPLRMLSRATFSRVDLRLSRYEVFDAQNRLALAVDYREYKSGSGADVPSVVTADWPLEGFGFTAKARTATVGVKLHPRLWQFEWRPGAVIVDLDESRAEPPRPAGKPGR